MSAEEKPLPDVKSRKRKRGKKESLDKSPPEERAEEIAATLDLPKSEAADTPVDNDLMTEENKQEAMEISKKEIDLVPHQEMMATKKRVAQVKKPSWQQTMMNAVQESGYRVKELEKAITEMKDWVTLTQSLPKPNAPEVPDIPLSEPVPEHFVEKQHIFETGPSIDVPVEKQGKVEEGERVMPNMVQRRTTHFYNRC